MTRGLVVLFVAMQALDLATFMLAPHLESNPAMRQLPVPAVLVAKLAGVALALAIVSAIRTPSLAALALGVGIAVAGVCLGANVATIAATRPAASVIPAARMGFDEPDLLPRAGVPQVQRRVSNAAPKRPTTDTADDTPDRPSATSTSQGRGPVWSRAVPDRAPLRHTSPVDALSGVATWYAAPDATAAAGPALRAALGRQWRGQRVRVCAAGHCVRVTLRDWCACGPRHGVPTLIDLSDGDFARLAPLSAGVLRVSVR